MRRKMPKAQNAPQNAKSEEWTAERQKRMMRSKTSKAQNAQQNAKSP
jgi:hypothetical protein